MLYPTSAIRGNSSKRFILFFLAISCMRRAMLVFFLIFIFSFFSPTKAQDTTCGIAWGPVMLLSKQDIGSYEPQIGIQSETLHVTWNFGGGYRLPYTRSTNGGIAWDTTRELLNDSIIYTRSAHDPFILTNTKAVFIIYVSTHGDGNTPVYCIKSTDAGTTWSEPVAISSDSSTRMSDATILEDTIIALYIHTPMKILRSTDGGDHWGVSRTPAERGTPRHTLTPGILHEVYRNDTITNSIETFYKRSTDLGDTWSDTIALTTIDEEWSYNAAIGTSINNGVNDYIFVTWLDTKYGCRGLVGCSILLRRSTDAGLTWQPETLMTELPNGFNNGFSRGQIASYQDHVGIVWTNDETQHINMRYSLNSGDTWSDICDMAMFGIKSGYPNLAVSSNEFHVVWSDYFQGFWGIYYRRGVLLPDAVREETETPVSFSLEQNYPNPFNPSTTLSFVIRYTSFVTLKIYNLLGQEVATIVHEYMNSGTYSKVWNAEEFPSGIYTYRLNAFDKHNGLQSLTKKMILTK